MNVVVPCHTTSQAYVLNFACLVKLVDVHWLARHVMTSVCCALLNVTAMSPGC